jgi:hypothetical protein
MAQQADPHYRCKKQKAVAWRKYYEALEIQADMAGVIIRTIGLPRNAPTTRPADIPTHITAEFYDMGVALQKQFSCPVCLDLTTKDTIAITWCGHVYCKTCLTALKEQDEPKCGICRKKI